MPKSIKVIIEMHMCAISIFACRRKTIWLQHLSSCLCAKGDSIPPLNDTFWSETFPVSALREELHTAGGT